MPDEKAKGEETQAEAKPSKKGLIIVAAIMLLEGAGVAGIVMVLRGGASPAVAEIEGAELAAEEKLVEISLVEDKFQNLQTGKTWVWECEIVLQVRKKNEQWVTAELEARKAEITEGVALIFRRAQHVHLTEPGLETLNRQLTVYAHEVFGDAPDGTPRVERVIIPKCRGFRS